MRKALIYLGSPRGEALSVPLTRLDVRRVSGDFRVMVAAPRSGVRYDHGQDEVENCLDLSTLYSHGGCLNGMIVSCASCSLRLIKRKIFECKRVAWYVEVQMKTAHYPPVVDAVVGL